MHPRRGWSHFKTLASLSRINLLHELQTRGSLTVAELAAATGLHQNTAREHLHRLIDAGFARSEPIPRTSKGRPKALYSTAAHPGDPARRSRRHAAEVRIERFRRLGAPSEIGLDRTPVERQLDMLDDHMDQCGFDAEINPDASQVTVRECPFWNLVRDNPEVCRVHFALVQDALQLAEGPLVARELHPFSGPHGCTVDLESNARPAR